MADIFPLALDENREFFDAEGFSVKNVGEAEEDADVVSLRQLKETTISQHSRREDLLETLKYEIDGKSIASIILETILSSPTQETVDEISKSLSTLVKDKPFGSIIMMLLLAFAPSEIQTSVNDDTLSQYEGLPSTEEVLKRFNRDKTKKQLVNSGNFYADSVSESIDTSEILASFEDYKKTFTDIYNKNSNEHATNIVNTLFSHLLKSELSYTDCCDILTNYNTTSWKKPLIDYRNEKRAKNIFFDMREAVLLFQYKKDKYDLISISPSVVRHVFTDVVFQNITVRTVTSSENIKSVVIVDSSNTHIEGIYSESTNSLYFSHVEGIFYLLDTNPNNSTSLRLMFTADFYIKKADH